jgi:hypothetical protein
VGLISKYSNPRLAFSEEEKPDGARAVLPAPRPWEGVLRLSMDARSRDAHASSLIESGRMLVGSWERELVRIASSSHAQPRSEHALDTSARRHIHHVDWIRRQGDDILAAIEEDEEHAGARAGAEPLGFVKVRPAAVFSRFSRHFNSLLSDFDLFSSWVPARPR